MLCDGLEGGELVVERVPDQGMSEAHPPRHTGHLAHEALGHRLLDRREDVGVREPGEVAQGVEPELPAQHGSIHQEVPAGGGQPTQPAADDRADAGRDAQLRGLVREAPLGVEQAHHLAQKQGVALRLGVDGSDQPTGRLGGGRARDVVPDLADGQPRERDPDGVGLADEIPER